MIVILTSVSIEINYSFSHETIKKGQLKVELQIFIFCILDTNGLIIYNFI